MDQPQTTQPTPTDDGMDDGAHYFDELVEQVGVWSRKNFGDQPAWRPVMGMVEELCELTEKFETLDLVETLDAIGDTAIYMADYFHRRGWKMGELWRDRHILPDGSDAQPMLSRVISLIRGLCHSHLKGDQGIRGGSGKHDFVMQMTCKDVLILLEEASALLDRDVIHVIQEVWEVVGRRDWTENPNNAHEVAASSGGLVPASEP